MDRPAPQRGRQEVGHPAGGHRALLTQRREPVSDLQTVDFDSSYCVTTSCNFVLDDNAGLCEVAVTVTV